MINKNNFVIIFVIILLIISMIVGCKDNNNDISKVREKKKQVLYMKLN